MLDFVSIINEWRFEITIKKTKYMFNPFQLHSVTVVSTATAYSLIHFYIFMAESLNRVLTNMFINIKSMILKRLQLNIKDYTLWTPIWVLLMSRTRYFSVSMMAFRRSTLRRSTRVKLDIEKKILFVRTLMSAKFIDITVTPQGRGWCIFAASTALRISSSFLLP